MSDTLIIIATICVISIGAISGIIGLASWASRVSCNERATIMGLEHSYSLMTDCMVKYEGRWIPLHNVRAVAP